MITINNLKDLLITLGFEEEGNTYQKAYGEPSLLTHPTIKVNFDNGKITYPEGLTVHREDICNFSQNENFVVLECVHRLLEKGYKPEHLELEPRWQLGRGASGGRADILVKDQENNPLLLIECKTAGEEFDRAWRKTLQNGDQLFSYAQQIQQTQYLCLYASDFVEGDDVEEYKIRIDQRIIAHRDNKRILEQHDNLRAFADATNVEDRYAIWRDTYEKEYTETGIFEDNIQPYNIGKEKYTLKDDTKPIDATDADKEKGKYHRFRTILRQHNIARREQAFEVLVNLFLTKLVDEEQNRDDLQFSWKGIAYDDYFDFVDRLQNLYKTGMHRYLDKEISYISNEQIDNAFWAVKNDKNATKKQIQIYFRQLKFFTNSAFSLHDTYNEELFKKNAKVLLEIVQMWQGIRLKTDTPNQFLGDMFELFLDDGVKQSNGQFFTPLPICKFIVSSLPLEQKISENDEPLNTIDYACGSGHFLNEYAHQIKPIVEYMNGTPTDYYSHITGIEKEDRLAKVAKVAAYMHGQGQIKILDIDALAEHRNIKGENYDVLISNPPFAVEGFLRTLTKTDKEHYQLIKATGEDSDTNTIQCFFLERIQHLMSSEGVVGVIVPSSILSNTDAVHIKTREVLIKYFDFVSVAELGSGTFGKTGTNTVILFLKRKKERPEREEQYFNRVQDFFEGDEEEIIYQDHPLIEAYCNHNEIPYTEYIKLFEQTNLEPLEDLLEYEIFQDYKRDFNPDKVRKEIEKSKDYRDRTEAEQTAELGKRFIKYIHDIEKDKLYYFILAHTQACQVLIVNAPTNKREQKTFLGYEWSSRRGSEGIQYIGGNTVNTVNDIITPLFDPKDLNNPEKINTAIKRNFTDEPAYELPEHCQYANLTDMLDFSRISFNKAISLNPKLQLEVTVPAILSSVHPMKSIDRVLTLEYGISLPEDNRVDGDYPVYGSNGIVGNHNNFLVKAPCIIVGRKGSVGQINWSDKDCTPIDTTFYVKLLDESATDMRFIYYILKSLNLPSLKVGLGPGGINRNYIYGLKIPNPPLNVQQQIVNECEAVDQQTDQAHQTITTAKQEIEEKVQAIINAGHDMKRLEDIAEDLLAGGDAPNNNFSQTKTDRYNIPIYANGVENKGLYGYTDTARIEKPSITISARGTLGYTEIRNEPFYPIVRLIVLTPKVDLIDISYLKHVVSRLDFTDSGAVIPQLTVPKVRSLQIPVPPLNIQQQFIAEIERLETTITEAQAIIDTATERKNVILTEHL